jgi:septum formation protein
MIILASKSPRRHELMRLITDDFTVVTMDTDETIPQGMPPYEAVRLLAERKARNVAVGRDRPSADIALGTPTIAPRQLVDVSTPIIGADTLVYCDGQILEKPLDAADALRMLRLLSGNVHSVFTGVCVLTSEDVHTFAEESLVYFHEHSDDELREYIAAGESMDKAGAYGIQCKGALLVRRIEGDYFNVMGLPVSRLYRVLKNYKILH